MEETMEETMDSFEQIKLQKETKEKLDEYQTYGSQEEVVRLNDLREKYGEKNPGEISFWKAIWDEYNMEYKNGIPEEYIPKVAMGALGLSPKKTNNIVEIGVDFALLIEGKPESAANLDFIDEIGEETVYRLILPEERPDLYLENPKQFAERETWSELWNVAFGGENVVVGESIVKAGVKSVLDIKSDEETRAAVKVGKMAGAIKETEDGLSLASERPRGYWLDIWEIANITLGTPTEKSQIEHCVGSKVGNIEEAKEIVSDAIETGELYSPEGDPDDHYTINDPATDEGPEIIKESDTTDDDDDDDEGSGQIEDSGDNPSDQSGTTQPSQTVSSPSPANNTEEEESDTTPVSQNQPTSSTSSAESEQRTAATEREDQAESSAATASSQTGSESISSPTQSGGDQSKTQPTTNTDSSTTTESESTIATSDTADSSAGSTSSDTPNNQSESESDNGSTSQNSKTTKSGDGSSVVKRTSADDSSEQEADDEDVDLIKQRHNANRKPEDELEVAVNVEEGVNLNEVMEELNSDDSHDRFETYEEPQVDEGMYDRDREAVRQFVAGFCTLHPDKKEEVKVENDMVLSAFETWAEINDVELDEVSKEVYLDNRKGNLKNIIVDEFDVEADQFSIDGERTRGIRGMRLSDSGKELLDINIE